MQQYMEIIKTAKRMSIKYSIHFHNFIEIDTSQNISNYKKEHRKTCNDSNRPKQVNHSSRALKWIMGTKYFSIITLLLISIFDIPDATNQLHEFSMLQHK